MNYIKFLFCTIACLCLTCVPAKAQCPSGYVPINYTTPNYLDPNWLGPTMSGNSCWEAFQSTLDQILLDFISCQKAVSPPGYPDCTTITESIACATWRDEAFALAYDAYVDCIMENYPPPSTVTPPPGVVCDPGQSCMPDSAYDLYPPAPPLEGDDENGVCYTNYIYNLKYLYTQYYNGISSCDHTGFYCWDCACVSFWKQTYQYDADQLYADYLACVAGY